ncbi:MAG: amidohydrolase family protein [Gemmatimonadota bacterium]
MSIRARRWSSTLSALALVLPLHLLTGQERAQDKRRWLSPTQEVSDDPRRVPVPSGPKGPDGTIVLRGGRVFDGTGSAARAATVVITRNRIASVLDAASTNWPRDARVIDVTGKTVMPGLIDMHTHLTYVDPPVSTEEGGSVADPTLRAVQRLRYFIESGVTSVRDVASDGEIPFRLKQWVARNDVAGPRIFAAGQLITAPGGHGAEAGPDLDGGGSITSVTGADAWRNAVRVLFRRGADVIKIASHFSRDEVKAAVEEAHALGLKVTCDCETFYIQWAVEAGVDMIEHPLPRTDETIRLMAERKVEAIPTVFVYTILFDASGGGYFGSTSRRFNFNDSLNLDVMRRMHRAGIKLGVGTDLVVDWYRQLPTPYINELKYFTAVGYTPAEALVAATKTNAELLDMDDKLGTLEPGKLADVIVVNGRPDQSLDDLAKVELVIRDGWVVVEGGRLSIPRHQATPSPRPFGVK